MTRISWLFAPTLVACAAPALAPSRTSATSTSTSTSCSAPAHRQLDFWLGDWDLVLRTRASPESEQWTETRGENHIRATLRGCVIEEDFAADPTGQPWAGKSHSTYVPALGAWRQTWVDDEGGYLAFRGGKEGDGFALYGEPREVQGKTVQMRMVWRDITKDAFTWSWERGVPDGTEWKPMLVIRYARRGSGASAGASLDAQGCDADPAFHDMDFWLGEWKVTTADGRLAGKDRVEKVLAGCGITETWTDVDGGAGRSLFFRAPGGEPWKQVWVTDQAKRVGGTKEKRLVERGADGSLRFQGELPLPSGGVLLDRTTLTPLGPTKVRQRIEISRDGGASWTTTFDAVYERA